MLFPVDYGRRPYFVKHFEGQFQCPNCGPSKYLRSKGRMWWYVYYVPLFPRQRIDSLYCLTCYRQWESTILGT